MQITNHRLLIVDGLVTLAVKYWKKQGAIKLWRATWLEQGRGYSLNKRSGLIAEYKDIFAHCDNEAQAVRYISKKIATKNSYLYSIDDLKKLATKHKNANLTVADVHAIGACHTGIRSFRHKHSLPQKISMFGALKLLHNTDIPYNDRLYIKKAALLKLSKLETETELENLTS